MGAKADNKEGGKNEGGGDNKKQKKKMNKANKIQQKKDENRKKTPPKEGEAHEKKIKGRTWHLCQHHVAWGNQKESDCQHGKDCTDHQIISINQVTAQAALATILNPKWQALMANMARNMANDCLARPALKPWITFSLVFMAEANLNKAHQVLTYLILIFPLSSFPGSSSSWRKSPMT